MPPEDGDPHLPPTPDIGDPENQQRPPCSGFVQDRRRSKIGDSWWMEIIQPPRLILELDEGDGRRPARGMTVQ
jgi:hypothetical protein